MCAMTAFFSKFPLVSCKTELSFLPTLHCVVTVEYAWLKSLCGKGDHVKYDCVDAIAVFV